MKILIFGGSGLLGEELKKLNALIISPTHNQCNINIAQEIDDYIHHCNPDIIINAAAIIDNRQIELSPTEALITNIIGSTNIAIACIKYDVRLVYISSDYVYKGDKGNYKETDEIQPFNLYAWTKLGGECAVKGVKNHLIIRTSFGQNKFDYKDAFTDKYASKDYVDIIAPLIYDASISPITGILNLGSSRRSIYDYACLRNDNVQPVRVSDTYFYTPYDTSLNLQKWQDYKSIKSTASSHKKCRICDSEKLIKYVDLGLMPLANNLDNKSIDAKLHERFPLQVMFCEECGLSQLSIVIEPSKMFAYYTYRSAINAGYVKHCRDMSIKLQNKYKRSNGTFHIDIAGNDGTLLKEAIKVNTEYHPHRTYKVLNVDPASNLTAISEAQGVESISDFWSSRLALDILKKYSTHADIITATNVFAHVDDVKDFMKAVTIALHLEGVLVLEFPYLVDFIEKIEFDTVYFEHLSYVSILPLMKLCKDNNMRIIDIEKQNIHGGTVRVSIAHEGSEHIVSYNVDKFIHNEKSMLYDNAETYSKWSASVKNVINDFSVNVFNLKKQGYKIASFAASAKGNTLLNCAGMTTDIIDYICDETPEKIGKFSPGTGIPIVNKQMLTKNPPDYLIILSWNFAEEIIAKLRPIYSGKFIIPVPVFTILD